ncbi:MAG: lipocalin family protein [Azonexus sp.]|nr:lipocalin family protein [Azonexus sp.]
MMTLRAYWLAPLLALMLSACALTPPTGLRPVTGFDINRYLGSWYEIARLDHSFERDMQAVSATYVAQPNGSVNVINRGYDTRRQGWKEALGRAWLIGDRGTASLKVSFFGPFYGAYHVIALDPDYRWSLVTGSDRDYLWILAREAHLPDAVRDDLIARAKAMGFATERLIWVDHTLSYSPQPGR